MRRLALAAALVVTAVLLTSAPGSQATASPEMTTTAILTQAAPPAPLLREATQPQLVTSSPEQLLPIQSQICGGNGQGCCPGSAKCASGLVCIEGICHRGW